MFERMRYFIKRMFSNMIDSKKIEEKLDASVAVGSSMASAIDLWAKMYADEAPWLDANTRSMGLAASIASELARLTTLEFKSKIAGCDFLEIEYKKVLVKLRENCEYGCAGGGLVFKPYIDGKHIAVEAIGSDSFFPVSFNGRGEVRDSVFLEYKVKGDDVYTRLERHQFDGDKYIITNRAFINKNTEIAEIQNLGTEVELTVVDEWAELDPVVEISNIDKCLFGYFKVPLANTIEPESPLGVSVYSRAVDKILEADLQWSRILWEYEGSELAIHASVDCFKRDEYGNWLLPEGRERLYRAFEYDPQRTKAIDVFSPSIRDTSLFNGLNNILKRIEFDCGLAYGTLSDPQNVDKTAEEIKTSKQRSYQMVSDIQRALQTALEDLLYAMVKLGQIAGLPVTDNYDVSFNWDDSVIVDKEKQLASMQLDVSSGILRPELYIAEKYGVTEEEALKMMPKSKLKEEVRYDEE